MTPGTERSLIADHPVEQGAQLHRRVLLRHQVELVDLAQAGRHRRQLGPAVAGRDVVLGQLEPLADHLAREPDVGAVVEDDRHRRDRGAADRADLVDAGQAVHRRLDREGQVLLDLERRQPGRAGQDRDLRVGDVGDRVDRQLLDRHQRDAKRSPPRPPARRRVAGPRTRRCGPGSSQELALEQERAVGGDRSRRRSGPCAPRLCRRPRCPARRCAARSPAPVWTNTTVLPSTLLDRAARHRQHLAARLAVRVADHARGDELAGAQRALRVVELDAHLGRAGRLVDDRHDEGDAAAEHLARAAPRCASRPPGRRARAPGPSRTGRASTHRCDRSAILNASVARSTAWPSVTLRSMTVPSIGARTAPARRARRACSDASMSASVRPIARSRSVAARTPACSVTALRLAPARARAPTRCCFSARSVSRRRLASPPPRPRLGRQVGRARLADLGCSRSRRSPARA